MDSCLVAQDSIFISANLVSAATVTVVVGVQTIALFNSIEGGNHWSIGFDGYSGAVEFSTVHDGAVVYSGTGEALDVTNWNAWAGGS